MSKRKNLVDKVNYRLDIGEMIIGELLEGSEKKTQAEIQIGLRMEIWKKQEVYETPWRKSNIYVTEILEEELMGTINI